jgi:hypothetical protein
MTGLFSRRLLVRTVFFFLASVGVVLAAACGGKVVVDATSGAGGIGGASTTSTTASTTATTAVTVGCGTPASGTSTGTGVGGNGSTSDCESCNAFISSGPNGQSLCGAAQGIFDALRTCACQSGTCLTQCATDLCENAEPSSNCTSCLMSSCVSQQEACLGS